MELSFTKKQVEFMIYSLYLGSWVSCRDGQESQLTKEIESLEQYVLGFAYNMKWFDWIDYERSTGAYIIKPEREEDLLANVIDSYDEEVFWEELKSRLAMRDILLSMSAADFDKKTAAEAFKIRMKGEERYSKEFKDKGLDRLVIKS